MEIERKVFDSVEFKAVDEALGIAEMIVSVFHNVDGANEIVMPGFFADSIAKRRNAAGQPRVKGVWGHDWLTPVAITLDAKELLPGDPMLPTSVADLGGLWVRGQFNLETQRGREAFSDLRFGSIDEFSIGYRTTRDEYDSETGVRRLLKGDLYEWSPVLVGMNDQTALMGTKAAEPAIESKAADPEPPESKDAVAGSFEERSELLSVALQGRYGSGMSSDTQDTMTWVYAVATFSDRVVVCIMGGGEEAYREVEYTLSDGEATLGADRPVDLQTTIVPKGRSYEDHSEHVRVAVAEWIKRTRSGLETRSKEGRAISEARRSRMATVRDQLRVGADEIDGMLAETEPKPKELDPALRAEFLRYQRLRAHQLVGASHA